MGKTDSRQTQHEVWEVVHLLNKINGKNVKVTGTMPAPTSSRRGGTERATRKAPCTSNNDPEVLHSAVKHLQTKLLSHVRFSVPVQHV